MTDYTIGPDGVPLIEIHPAPPPAPPGAGSDPWAAYRQPPKDASAAPDPALVATDTGGADPWAAFRQPPKDTSAPADNAPPKTFSAGDAAVRGALDAVTLGLTPAIVGATAAGSGAVAPLGNDAPTSDSLPDADASSNLMALGAGLRKLIGGDPDAKKTYDAARTASLNDKNNAAAQHPLPFIGGQIGGALLSAPVGGGDTLFARLLAASRAGAVGTGAYDAGSAVSRGASATDVAKSGIEGAGTGAAFGLAGSGAAEGVGAIGAKLMSLFRGTRDVDAEAGRRIGSAVAADYDHAGGFPLDPDGAAAAQAAGIPRAIVDTGGERTLALARSAANTSPEARAALSDLAQSRFEQQSPRVAGFIRHITGNPDSAADTETLQTAARVLNKPAYQAAYAAGDRVWSPELERLAGAPAFADAARGAVERGKNRAIVDGFGAFNPSLQVTDDGRLLFKRGPQGVPAHPSLQFWDYAQRELRDAASAAQRGGRNEEAGSLFALHRQLLSELDKQVPQFARARQGAAAFFKAGDALEAGRGFVMSNASIPEARTALAKMNPAERALFARGFASELAEKIERTPDRRNVINSTFLSSPAARTKVKMALGSDRAKQLEALLRAETVTDGLRRALGNSTTARQLAEMGLAGGAVATFEGLKEHDFNPSHIIAAALTIGAARYGAAKIDEGVARRVGELLASNDPAKLVKGARIVTSNPVLLHVLRRLTGAGMRVGAHDIGWRRSLAAAGAASGVIGGEDEGESDAAGLGSQQ
jgi:hypothetical protein